MSNELKRKALGRGLDALLPASRPAPGGQSAPKTLDDREESIAKAIQPEANASAAGVREIAIDLIDGNPYQTRGRLDEAALEELASSIKQSGVLQPVLVRPSADGRYQLMAGERRWMASKRAGKTTIPATVKPASDEQAMEITIIENLQREDLNPMEQARAFERLSREFSLTQEQIAQKTGKDRASVANFMRLTKLPEMIQMALEGGGIMFGHAKVLLMLLGQNSETMRMAARRVIEKNLTVRETEAMVRELLHPSDRSGDVVPQVKFQDPNVRAAERELQRTLGCKVTITDRGGRGHILLKYASLEDFDRVMEVLGERR